jgi:hypothetical protein
MPVHQRGDFARLLRSANKAGQRDGQNGVGARRPAQVHTQVDQRRPVALVELA